MHINDIMKIIGDRYPERYTDHYWNPILSKPAKGATGDTLAEFIVLEVVDTYDPSASDVAQLSAARRALRRACNELTDVVDGLVAEERRRKGEQNE